MYTNYPVKSTAKILAYTVLNRPIDETWINWAAEMLMAGFNTENLTILAGISAPYNQFELQDLTNKVFDELHLDYGNKDQIIKNYACYLIERALDKELESIEALKILKDICIELDYESYLYEFYLLYYAKNDLLYSGDQMYWEGADSSNIDSIITDYFTKWQTECETESKTTKA